MISHTFHVNVPTENIEAVVHCAVHVTCASHLCRAYGDASVPVYNLALLYCSSEQIKPVRSSLFTGSIGTIGRLEYKG